MKRTLSLICAAACAMMMTSCVIAVRSNLTFVEHTNTAEFEGTVKDNSCYDNGAPAVNADKSYSDMLNGSGNNNGAGQSERSAAPETDDTPAHEPEA